LVTHGNRADPGGGPAQKHVDRDVWPVVAGERPPQMRPERAEGADVPGVSGAEHACERSLRQGSSDVAPPAAYAGGRRAAYDVASLQGFEQIRNFLGRVLQIVVDGDDDIALSGADAREQRVVLSEVAQQIDAANVRSQADETKDLVPRGRRAAVVDEYD